MSQPATLYVVATPIGNLSDISLRAIETLKLVDLIAAEDTRHSGRLLKHLDISTPMQAYHDHSTPEQVDNLIAKLNSGKSIALISDAGTPLISDPGYPLVFKARAQGIRVEPIPGACAVIAALSASGLSSFQFSFEGFLPAKTHARQAILEWRKYDERTLIFYESPHRIVASLNDIQTVLGSERPIVLARELTKTFETFLSGSVSDVIETVRSDHNQQKGEMVILVQGFEKPKDEDTIAQDALFTLQTLMAELPLKQACTLAAKITGEKKNKLYKWAIEQKSHND